MINNAVMFSSTSDEWATPQDLFDRLNAIFHYNLDAAALPHNAKCERYFTPEQNGLAQRWSGNVWLNPSYGRKISEWVRKAYEEVAEGRASSVTLLLPARTDTA